MNVYRFLWAALSLPIKLLVKTPEQLILMTFSQVTLLETPNHLVIYCFNYYTPVVIFSHAKISKNLQLKHCHFQTFSKLFHFHFYTLWLSSLAQG